MKRLASIAAASFILVPTALGFAQQNGNPSPATLPYGYYDQMWGVAWGMGAGMIIGPIMMILILIGIVALIVLLVRGFSYGTHHHWYRHTGHP